MNSQRSDTIPFFSYFCLDKGLIIVKLFNLWQEDGRTFSCFFVIY